MKTRMLIPLTALVIMIPFWDNTFQIPTLFKQIEKSSSKEFSVLSYNVRMFDVYEWSNIKNSSKKIFTKINTINADIVVIQEFYAENGNGLLSESKIVSYMSKYPYKIIYYDSNNKIKGSGLAVFSKYPIEKSQFIPFKSSTNSSMSIDVKIQSKTIRLFNNHLESLRLSKEEVETVDSIPDSIEPKYIDKVKKIADKINNATSIRAKQVETLKNLIEKSPYPVVVCGDFNDTPISYAYNTIKGKLKDPFNEHGKWFGGTHNGLFFQPRIDYILHSETFESVDFITTKVFYSDHFPILAKFQFK